MGINAHPDAISALAISYDGRFLFSSGGNDLSAFMYEVNLESEYRSPTSGVMSTGEPVATNSNSPSSVFLSLLDGGDGGELHQDIVDYFYYCQLRAQGEESMNTRAATGNLRVGANNHSCIKVHLIDFIGCHCYLQV
jgi:cilia- and flagella-associated protein 251